MDALPRNVRCPAQFWGRKWRELNWGAQLAAKPLLIFGFLAAVLGGFLSALACAFRSSDVVGVLIWLLHRELENKTCRCASQEFLEKFTVTKVTSGGAPPAAGHVRELPRSSPGGHGTDAR